MWRRYLALLAVLLAIAFALSLWARDLERGIDRQVGLNRSVYAGEDLRNPPIVRDQATSIALDFLDQQPALQQGAFSVRWEGFWDLSRSGDVDFYLRADDRARIFVDDALVLEHSADEGARSALRTLHLDAGLHRLKVEFVQQDGRARLGVLWAAHEETPEPFAAATLYPYEPRAALLTAARRAPLVARAARVTWILFFAGALAAAIGVGIQQRQRIAVHSQQIGRAAAWSAVALIALRALVARIPGWNPESLWSDDLVWAAITRAQDWSTMLALPTHAPPGFFVLLRVARTLFKDPEWSLQILPLAAAIAAIPVMALLAKRVTGSDGLAVVAAALTALNPLLAHYSVFVKQYSSDFLITAALLLGGLGFVTSHAVDAGRFARFALLAGIALFFSVTSVFTSFAIVNLAALFSWISKRSERVRVAVWAAVYDGIVLAAYFILRARVNEIVQADFSEGFLPLSRLDTTLKFMTTEGRRLLETGLPSWGPTDIWAPETTSWGLLFLLAGMIWLAVRPANRRIAFIVLGFSAACLTASALRVYPIGPDRTDIFAFPVVILVAIFGVHAATAWSSLGGWLRAIVAGAAAVFAVLHPIHVEYWGVNDSRMIARVVASAGERDGLILSPTGTFLAAHYGPWPVTVAATTLRSNATDVKVDRSLTLHLPPASPPKSLVSAFIGESDPATVWYVGFRTGDNAEVVSALSEQGYDVTDVEETSRGHLYLAKRQRGLGR